ARRGRLLARLTKGGLELRAGDEGWPTLPLGDPRVLAGAFLDLQGREFKIRSRALTNTLYARLFLADLFIHGIGGGKYDELTDAIARRYYGFEPPGYLVLSATLRLPLPTYPARPEERRRLARAVRDLHYNPQRHLPAGALVPPKVRELAAEKQAWIEREPLTRQERRERFQVLRALNDQLHVAVEDEEDRLSLELSRCDKELAA